METDARPPKFPEIFGRFEMHVLTLMIHNLRIFNAFMQKHYFYLPTKYLRLTSVVTIDHIIHN